MNTTLSKEINKFSGLRSRLKQIIADTKRCYDEINISGRFEGTQIINTELQHEEEREITSVIKHPPTIIIFGQTTYAKSRIVNELLSKNIFPVLDENSIVKLRMVRIFHGTSNTVSCLRPTGVTRQHNPETNSELENTLELSDLEICEKDKVEKKSSFAELKVTQNHQLLKSGIHIVVSPSCGEDQIEDAVRACLENTTPILIYGFASDVLTEVDVLELSQISKQTNFAPVFFVRVPPPGSRTIDTDPPDGEPRGSQTQLSASHNLQTGSVDDSTSPQHTAGIKASLFSVAVAETDGATGVHVSHVCEMLKRLGYLDCDPEMKKFDGFFSVDSCFVEQFTDFGCSFATFTGKLLQSYLANASTLLNNSHTCSMNTFILSAFDMAREMLITPKKLEFVREQENELYRSLLKISVSKLDEVKDIITDTISIIRSCLIAEAAQFDFIGIEINQNGVVRNLKELRLCEEQIRELVLGRLNHVIAGKLVSSVDILRDSYTGTLTRCLESLETMNRDSPDGETTEALRQVLNAAYTVDITVRSSSSFIKNILEKMKQLVHSLPWRSSPTIDSDWKRKVATEMLNSLSESRLAKNISLQIKERLNKSHFDFANALKQLETRHTGRLDKIEEHRLKLRKVHAPQLAKLALESTSLKDVILYEMPLIEKEIGRGQYGVVYSCEKWGKCSPCAIKSVVPPDDKHWNDLALEFFYTKHIPDHDRIVMLRGSVIDYMYGGGTSPAVLLVMDRLQRDLHTAIRQGLDWISRLQVAIDVVEGLRYLHSQGLVHRDVKLKNVLLDKDNRGKVTDLGFCKPEVMMSGSIVGTPIHMAPELFTGHYDNSVDVYAFGILFWYVCAGHVHLPNAFEQCANKDQLWQSVKKGLRPEQPANVSDDCWQLMQVCWEGEPHQRPLFGEVESTLKVIYEKHKRKAAMSAERRRVSGDQSHKLSRRPSKPSQSSQIKR